MSLWDVTNKYKDAAIADRRHLHENPELGLICPKRSSMSWTGCVRSDMNRQLAEKAA